MAISATDNRLLHYVSILDEQQKTSLLHLIESFINTDTIGSSSTSIETYNRELVEALERVKQGRFTTIETLEEEMKEW